MPNKEPDLIIDGERFWFDEQICYSGEFYDKNHPLSIFRFINGRLYHKPEGSNKWYPMDYLDNSQILNEYLKWRNL